jgi:hypothetical protein
LQGTQNPKYKANLAKELQLPTPGKQFFNSGRQNTHAHPPPDRQYNNQQTFTISTRQTTFDG